MDSERHQIMPNEFEILDKYFKKVIKSNFNIEGGSSSVKKYPDSSVFKGQIALPPTFVSYKDTGYYHEVKDQEFIHFTSLDTLFKIINGGYFLATQFSNHDDPMELLFAGNVLKQVLSRNSIDLLKEFVFSLSMCKYPSERESFDMWRIYGNGGYGIGIVISFYPNQDSWNNTFLSRVYYENENHCLDKFTNFQNDHFSFLKNNPSLKLERNYSGEDGISDSIAMFLAYHKKGHFKIEDEVRFLKSYLAEDRIDPKDENLELLLNRKNETYFGYRIPIVSKNNLNKISSKKNLPIIKDYRNEVGHDISKIEEYLHDSPYIMVSKIILGYRYTKTDLAKFQKIETAINKRIGGPKVHFELSELSKQFHG